MAKKRRARKAEAKATAEAKARRADPRHFPQMLYQHEKRDDEDVLLTRTVRDPVELKEALSQGWKEKP